MRSTRQARMLAALATLFGAMVGMMMVGGCQNAPSGELPPLSHQPALQPGLLATVEAPHIPDWAVTLRGNHHLNPRPSESGYLAEETVITQRQRLWLSNGRPRESSSFRTWTWQLDVAPRR